MWPSIRDIREAITQGDGNGITVAILDTGIDESHPALATAEFSPSAASGMVADAAQVAWCPPEDLYGHGTAVAGIIHSLAPKARLHSIRVLGTRKLQHRHSVIRAGAMEAIETGAHILNCSFGVPGVPVTLPIYKEWTDHAFTKERHVVVASANGDPDEPHWPASFAQVLSVTAADLPAGSLRYRPGRLVCFEAPGVNVPVLAPNQGSAVMTGSSFAAAHLSGMLACVLSRFPWLPPGHTKDALRAMLSNTSTVEPGETTE